MDIEELFDRYVNGIDRAEDYIKWAEEQLAAGSNSVDIAILAGLNLEKPIDSEEVLDDFFKCIRDMGLEWPNRRSGQKKFDEKLIVHIARAILNGQTGIIEGSRQLSRLSYQITDGRDSDFIGFVGIDSETDHLPVGPVRVNWSNEALKEKDVEIKKAEDFYRNQAIEDCKRLIARFDKP